MYCPDCIEEMIEETRITSRWKFPVKRIFYVCPKCGYNVQKSTYEYYDKREKELWRESQNINLKLKDQNDESKNDE